MQETTVSPSAPGPAPRKRRSLRKLWIGLGLFATLLVGVGVGSSANRKGATVTVASPAVTVQADAAGNVVEPVTVTVAGAAAAAQTDTVTRTVKSPPKTVVETTTRTVVKVVRPRASASIPGDGTYLVGSDIQPGTYRSRKPSSGNCYYALLRSTDTINGIISNNNSAGQSVVTIGGGVKAFDTNGCESWEKIG